MDDPRDQLNTALKQAMVDKNAQRRDVVRMALSAVKQAEVDERKTLSAEEVAAILQREARTLRESLNEARNAGRGEAAQEHAAKLAILEEFLPRQLSREEIAAFAREAIQQSGATSAKDMGKIMAILMPKVKGLADGKLVNEVVREQLG